MQPRHARNRRIFALVASAATIAALGIAGTTAAHDEDAGTSRPTTPATTYQPAPAPSFAAPRAQSHTSRGTTQKSRRAVPAKPSTSKPAAHTTKHPSKRKATTPTKAVVIGSYRVCQTRPQPCIDAGHLTLYAGNILAGHNYMGWAWLADVPTGRTVRVTSGPVAGTYRVYGHMYLNRQGGSIPAFPGRPALVLQSCAGHGTGFSLLHRI